MNNEIKEIREYISCPQFGDNHYGKWGALRLDQRIKIKQILDYITNLQQEIKEANDSITWWTNRFKAVERDNRELKQENERLKEELFKSVNNTNNSMELTEDYKSRCEKAIEYIENEMPYLEEPDEEIERIDGSIYMTMKEYDKNIILNILQNGSEEK